jgi:hypothetical protein
MRSLVDPRMTTSLPEGFFASRVTIQDEAGVDVPGLVNLACAEGPGIRPDSGERRSPDLTVMSRERILLLTGFFPEIQEHWRAVVDGVAHDILAVEPSSSRAMTRLSVEAVGA